MEQILDSNAQPESRSLRRLFWFSCNTTDFQNRPYATSQVKDFSEKLTDVTRDLDKHTAGVKAVEGKDENFSKTGKGKKVETLALEDVETPLNKATKDR